jgi:cobalt-zinc-cadmium efflux system outer membrane protein
MGIYATPVAAAGLVPVRPSRARISFVTLLALLVAQSLAALEVTEAEAVTAALSRANFKALEISRHMAAEADVEQASLLPNPQASFGREGFTTGGGRTIETSYELSQQIDLAGRRGLATRAAAQRLSATDSEVRGDRQGAIAEVRKAFGDALYRARIVDTLNHGLIRLRRTADVIARLATAGEASGYDRRRVQRELQGARVRLEAAAAELARSRAMLAAYLEAPEPAEIVPVGSPLPAPPLPLAALRETLHDRPELAALLARADAAAGELAIAQRAWIPDVTIGVGNRVIEQLGAENDRVMLSLSMPLPVFDRGQPAAKRAAAQREGLRAEHALRLARLDADLNGLWQQATRLHAAALAFRTESLAGSRELTRIAHAAYQAGEGDVLDLIDAYRTELDTELLSLELDHRARLARIELDQTAGVSPHEHD